MIPTTMHITPIRQLSLDDLWAEAETLGALRVWTLTDYREPRKITGYKIELKGKRRNTEMEVTAQHTSLHCAIADAINEAREMGLGEQP